MDNTELLQELSRRLTSGELDRATVSAYLGEAPVAPSVAVTATEPESHFSITKILYVLGAVIVLIGIIYLVAQIWYDLGSYGRILVTLGLGLVFAASGSYLMKARPTSSLGSIFHVFGGLLIPGGAMVTLNEIGNPASHWTITTIFGGVFLFYLLLTWFHKHQILTFYAIAYGTTFIYLFVGSLPDTGIDELFAYLTMIIGVSYLLLAHTFRTGWNQALSEWISFFGSAGFLGAAFSQVFDSGAWQFVFFFFAVGGIAWAVYGKSRSVLVVSTLFLIAHFVYITNEYFTDSIGWPVSLVLIGFVIIGLGYASISLNRKYFGKSKSINPIT